TRVEYLGMGSHLVYKFEQYRAFGGRQFPRVLTEVNPDKPPIRVQVQELIEVSPDASQLAPPEDASSMPWCSNPTPARLLTPAKALFIPNSGLPPRPGAIYGIIGPDGHWHNLSVVKSAGKDLDILVMKWMGDEVYSPAGCGGGPAPQEEVRETP